MGGVGGVGWVVQLITLSLPTRVEVELCCDNIPINKPRLLGGWVESSEIIMPLCGPSCKLRLVRFSARLRFQDRPSMAIVSSVSHTGILAMMW